MTTLVTHTVMAKWLARAGGLFIWLVLALLSLWALAACYVDVRPPALRTPVAIAYAILLGLILIKYRLHARAALLCFACFCVVVVWWLSLKPTNQGNWQANVDRPAWVETDGDLITIHNLRNCDYRTEVDYTKCWSDRVVRLSQLRAVDLFFTTWGVRWIGHPILSFDFGNDQHIAFSIEARYKVGQDYSAILGFFRQYELIFVVADERDVIRLRTNYRKDEEVFLYRGSMGPEAAKAIFHTYTQYLDQLRDHPEWYNALTRNCTTTLDKQLSAEVAKPKPWNYQLLVNGTLDELLYDRGRFATEDMPFAQLKGRAHINQAARAADESPDFSTLIRAGRPGFDERK